MACARAFVACMSGGAGQGQDGFAPPHGSGPTAMQESPPPTPPRLRTEALVAELRDHIHRATAGQVGPLERVERQRFSEGVLVSETTISCWAALVWPAPVGF